MNQQPMNLRRAAKVARRYKIMIGVLALLGLVGGIGYTVADPPQITSQAIVVLPQPKPNIATQTLIAGSAPVLEGALPALGSGESFQSLQKKISVSQLTANAVSIAATGNSAARAEKEANAVAASYVAYIASSKSPVGAVVARILVSATTATGMSEAESALLDGGIGLLVALLIGFVVAVRRDRGDRRIWQRDQIALAAGAPVLAGLSEAAPSGADGWVQFFTNFDPIAGNAWQLRTVLDQLPAVSGGSSRTGLTVLSVSADRRALTLGPQLAAYAAGVGKRTALVIGPHQPPADAGALQGAAAAGSQLGNLRIFTANMADDDWFQPSADLSIAVVAADGTAPAVPEAVGAMPAVLAVTAGAVTSDELARVASAVRRTGTVIAGVIVGDPDPNDGTTGRGVRAVRFAPARPPARVNGKVTEMR